MKITYLLFSILLVLLISSCSKDDFNNSIEDNAIIKPKLTISESKRNIFEYTTVSTFEDQLELSLLTNYDSVVWKAPKINGSFNLYNQRQTVINFQTCFYLPGEYKTYLIGYKNKTIIYCDSTDISISNNKDFLQYNWSDKDDNYSHSTSNAFANGYIFSTNKNTYQDIPYVRLEALPEFPTNTDLFYEQNIGEIILLRYINSLYSTDPTYDITDGNILLEKYNSLFNYRIENETPLYIWITSNTKIVLVKSLNGIKHFIVYAEPNK